MDDNDKPLPIIEHWLELRKRILICLASVFTFSLISYFFSTSLIRLLTKPFGGEPLIFIAPTEAFSLIIKVSVLSGIILSSPIIFYNLWKFLSAALNRDIRSKIVYYFSASVILSILGIIFSYFIVIPAALKFLMGVRSDILKPLITANNYFSFTLTMILAFVFVFQLPLIMIFLVKNNIMPIETFSQNRHYAILIIFIAAAILTPTVDAFTQLCLAVPLIILYEGSILFFKIL